MLCFFQKIKTLRLESDLILSDDLSALACRDALQDVLHMLRRCSSGEQLIITLNKFYERYAEHNNAPYALACAFEAIQLDATYFTALNDVKASYEVCFPYATLATLLFGVAAASASVGTALFGIVVVLTVCLIVCQAFAYKQAQTDSVERPRALDNKLLEINQALRAKYPDASDVAQKQKALDKMPLCDIEDETGLGSCDI